MKRSKRQIKLKNIKKIVIRTQENIFYTYLIKK